MSEMAQFIYTLKVTRLGQLTEGPTAREQAIVARHFAYLQDLTEKGVAILIGRTQTADADTFGIVLFQAASEAEAQEVMANDPAVKNGVMTALLYPFKIALMQSLTQE
jgi:uncharacterized protein YciI